MPTYHDLLVEMGQWGPYMGDIIGKCQREIHAFAGTGQSRIDKYLRESATYKAALNRRNLKAEYRPDRAERGFLVWKEGRTNGIKSTCPIAVDEKSGIIRQLDREHYGLLADVRECLHRKSADGEFVPWGKAQLSNAEQWQNPTQEDIDKHDASKSTFGTAVVGGKRVGHIGWRRRVAKLWHQQCAITSCKMPEMLDGAHVLPHKDSTTEQRLDDQNGIYLAAHLHRAFDRGLISFSADGQLLYASSFSPGDRASLGLPTHAKLPFVPERTKEYLKVHRRHYGFE